MNKKILLFMFLGLTLFIGGCTDDIYLLDLYWEENNISISDFISFNGSVNISNTTYTGDLYVNGTNIEDLIDLFLNSGRNASFTNLEAINVTLTNVVTSNTTITDEIVLNGSSIADWSDVGSYISYLDLIFTGTTGLSDGIDNDTTYTNVSEFANDVGYIANGTSANLTNLEVQNIIINNNFTLNSTTIQDLLQSNHTLASVVANGNIAYNYIRSEGVSGTDPENGIVTHSTSAGGMSLAMFGGTTASGLVIEEQAGKYFIISSAPEANVIKAHNPGTNNIFIIDPSDNGVFISQGYEAIQGTSDFQLILGSDVGYVNNAQFNVSPTGDLTIDATGGNIITPDDFSAGSYTLNATLINDWSDLAQYLPYLDLDFTGTTGLSDGIDNDTTYTNVSEFTNDVGYIANGTNANLLDLDVNNITNLNNIYYDNGMILGKNVNASFIGLDYSFDIDNPNEIAGGDIVFSITHQGRILRTVQSGLAYSASMLGNSQVIRRYSDELNATLLSSCQQLADYLNISLEVACDSAQFGADLVVENDIQAFGEIFAEGGGIFRQNLDFIGNGGVDLKILNSDLYIRNVIIEESISNGTQTIVDNPFLNGAISDFYKVNQVGTDTNNWETFDNADTDIYCVDEPCARARGGNSQAKRIMQLDTDVTVFKNISFHSQLGFQNPNVNANFTLFVNNGSGFIKVYERSNFTGADILPYELNITLGSEYDSVSNLSIQYQFSSSGTNQEAYLSDFSVTGLLETPTVINVTRFNSKIIGGDGSGDVFIFYNDTSKNWVFSPANVTFATVTEVDLNVSNSIALNGTSIFDWSELAQYLHYLNLDFTGTTGLSDGIDNDTTYTNLSEFTNDVGYLTEYNETDPIWISDKTNYYNISLIDNLFSNYYNSSLIDSYLALKLNVSDQRYNDTLLINSVNDSIPVNVSQLVNDRNYLNLSNLTGWDTNVSDDFDTYHTSLNFTNTTGLSDGIDNDTTYTNVSEFTNDVGYIANGTSANLTNLIITNLINLNGSIVNDWSEVANFGYENLSQLYNDVGFIQNGENVSFDMITANTINISGTSFSQDGVIAGSLQTTNLTVVGNASINGLTVSSNGDIENATINNLIVNGVATLNGETLVTGNISIQQTNETELLFVKNGIIDSSPNFVVNDTSGRLNIYSDLSLGVANSSDPQMRLHIQGNGADESSIAIERNNNNMFPPHFYFRSSGGVPGARTQELSGYQGAQIHFQTYTGTAYVEGASIITKATEDVTAASYGTDMSFYITKTGTSTKVKSLHLENDGTLSVAGVTNYEVLITSDDDILNKKYIDDLNYMSSATNVTVDDITVTGFINNTVTSGCNYKGAFQECWNATNYWVEPIP